MSDRPYFFKTTVTFLSSMEATPTREFLVQGRTPDTAHRRLRKYFRDCPARFGRAEIGKLLPVNTDHVVLAHRAPERLVGS